jgi:hypothetical protein
MARLGRVLPAVFVTGGDPDSVNDTLPSNTSVGGSYDLTGQFGAVLRSNDGLREYIYARFSSTSTGKTPAANQLCFWVTNSTANLATPGQWVVDNQTSANTGTSVADVAGVLRNACTRGNGVWLLRKSALAVPIVSTSTLAALSGAVIASTASGEAVGVVNSTSTTAATQLPIVGWVASTSTAGSFVGSTATGGIGVNIPVFLSIE